MFFLPLRINNVSITFLLCNPVEADMTASLRSDEIIFSYSPSLKLQQDEDPFAPFFTSGLGCITCNNIFLCTLGGNWQWLVEQTRKELVYKKSLEKVHKKGQGRKLTRVKRQLHWMVRIVSIEQSRTVYTDSLLVSPLEYCCLCNQFCCLFLVFYLGFFLSGKFCLSLAS